MISNFRLYTKVEILQENLKKSKKKKSDIIEYRKHVHNLFKDNNADLTDYCFNRDELYDR